MFQFPADLADLPAGGQVFADNYNLICVNPRNLREKYFLFQYLNLMSSSEVTE
jgi:hypothetical protein